MERKEFLNKVFGYERIKDELYEIRSWYLDEKLEEDKREYLPKGILFYGEPGYGKTLLIREYAKSFDYKIFIVEGDAENLDEVLAKTYEDARKEKNSIVIIDELDRLVDKDTKLERVLQMQLDGINKDGNVLTLASANYIFELPDALLREGRFDRKFKIEIHDKKELEEILNNLIKIRGFNLNQNEIDELSQHLKYQSVSSIKSIFNSVYFRYGLNAKIDDFINEYLFNDTGEIPDNDNLIVKDDVAIHEAGHALYIYKYSQKYKFLRVIITKDGGRTYSSPIEVFDCKKSMIERLDISLAGMVAEKILLKEYDTGSRDDLNKAYDKAFDLVNKHLICGFNYFCSDYNSRHKDEISEFENKLFAKRANKFMKKRYKIVKRRLRKYKKEIALLGKIIKEKKGLTFDGLVNTLDKKKFGSNLIKL